MSRTPDPNDRIAREVWDEYAAQHGGRVDIDELPHLLAPKLYFDVDAGRMALAQMKIRKLDQKRTRTPPANQSRLLPDDDAYLVTGENQRVQEKHALYDDWMAAVNLEIQNMHNVVKKQAWNWEKFVAHEPYMRQGMTLEEAAKALARDVPNQPYWKFA